MWREAAFVGWDEVATGWASSAIRSFFGARERPANILKRRRSKSRRRAENTATASRTGKISAPLANVATCSK